ncbi:Rad1/Rec1/Rad17 [Gymnopilus junonius]|uniref:Rad1/Rec1/Rad17 n=1 Tax=Gymnopilus junonius TaxID=109634 RepID=A0A9P5N8B6_GYMJU|nr:Rad1/Rec1/Rad17 [Gymnopilus junonius]
MCATLPPSYEVYSFPNRATVTVTDTGLTITVEEARTLLGTAFIFADVFDEYAYHPETLTAPPSIRPRDKAKNKKRKRAKRAQPKQGELSETESETEDDENDKSYQPDADEDVEAEREGYYPENSAFEVPLDTLIDCLNIFGTAGSLAGAFNSSDSGNGGRGKARIEGEEEGKDDEGAEGANPRGLDAYFGGKTEKKTSMRLSYPGAGYPLTLIVAEDASGPTTTCEITVFDPEPHLELDFDNSKTVLKIILKSSWLRDALSELDPSCEKLTFVGNPPIQQPDHNSNARQKGKQRVPAKPMLRIQANGTFGSTEMDYPNDRDVLETFECTRIVAFSYRFGHIARTLKALSNSTKTSLRIDEDGLLSLQFLMPSPRPKTTGGRADAFIEFRCLALDDEM